MTQTEKTIRQKKALLVFPLIAIPFLTLIFWSLGGGKGISAQAAPQQQKGLNTALPQPQLSGQSVDKMSLYQQAVLDSQNRQGHTGDLFGFKDTLKGKGTDTAQDTAKTPGKGGLVPTDPNEEKVRAKLNQLQHIINQPVSTQRVVTQNQQGMNSNPAIHGDVEKLQQMMQSMNQSNQDDPQLQQLNGMLEKILDIEHPDRVKQQLKEQSIKNRGRVYAVNFADAQTQAGLVSRTTEGLPAYETLANGFYDLNNTNTDTTSKPAIPAVVQETQTVVSGSTIKLRLTDDIFINGTLIPKNNFIYGSCSVDGERLKVAITGIRYHNNLFPVSLAVYDLDALEGIRVPGAISRDASKEGADRAIQSVQMMSLDPSFGAQAATAGVEAAKGLFSKKVKLIRVTVKAGYPVLLLDDKARQNNN